MTHICNEFTYWNNNGENQWMLDEMEAAGWQDHYTAKSKADVKRYHRYYNDGDMPRGRDFSIYMTYEEIERVLEWQVDTMILREYERFIKSYKKAAK